MKTKKLNYQINREYLLEKYKEVYNHEYYKNTPPIEYVLNKEICVQRGNLIEGLKQIGYTGGTITINIKIELDEEEINKCKKLWDERIKNKLKNK